MSGRFVLLALVVTMSLHEAAGKPRNTRDLGLIDELIEDLGNEMATADPDDLVTAPKQTVA